MVTGAEVLTFLIPDGGWVITGDDYEGIQFLECDSITKAVFEAGFSKVEAFKKAQEEKFKTDKELARTKLAALGLTLDDLKTIGL
jgi:hypothetical protein